MDFIVSYHLQKKLKKKESSDELKELKEGEEIYPIRESCSRCGQNPYLCQCQSEKYSTTKYRFSESVVFDPEKDNY